MNSRQITNALWWSYRGSSDLLIPRYTPANWWECDVWRLRKSGFVDEFEIKTSLADFRNDLRKVKSGVLFDEVQRRFVAQPEVRKHELLKGESRGPNRFWFVVPRELASKIEVPEYAGLIVCSNSSTGVEKDAPNRHGRKWEGDRMVIMQTFYWRFWSQENDRKGPVENFQGDPIELSAATG